MISQNYPNPFNLMTIISFCIPSYNGGDGPQRVTISVYDIRGRRVKKLVEEDLVPGYHETCWDGKDEKGTVLPSGIYLYKLTVGEKVIPPRKMVLAR